MSDAQAQPIMHTVRSAAARVERSVRTIELWIQNGDLEVTPIKDAHGRTVRLAIEEGALLSVWRAKLTAPKGGKGHARLRGT